MNIQIQDKNVLNVMARFKERSEVGMKKYKTTLERTDLTTLEWRLFGVYIGKQPYQIQ